MQKTWCLTAFFLRQFKSAIILLAQAFVHKVSY